jgi:transposase
MVGVGSIGGVVERQHTQRREAPRKRGHFIGMGTHCQFCAIAVVNRAGELVLRERCRTSVPTLLQVLEQVSRPRALVIEEGPRASWLGRNLHAALEDRVVSEPRRHRLLALEGDKDDDLDAEKLAQLFRGGYVKAVHQVQTLERAVFKQPVALYHHRVRQRVREALRISSLSREHGVLLHEKAFVTRGERPALLARLPEEVHLREMVSRL